MPTKKPAWRYADIAVATRQARRAEATTSKAASEPATHAQRLCEAPASEQLQPVEVGAAEQATGATSTVPSKPYARIIKPTGQRGSTHRGAPTVETVFGAEQDVAFAKGYERHTSAPTAASVFKDMASGAVAQERPGARTRPSASTPARERKLVGLFSAASMPASAKGLVTEGTDAAIPKTSRRTSTRFSLVRRPTKTGD